MYLRFLVYLRLGNRLKRYLVQIVIIQKYCAISHYRLDPEETLRWK